MGLGLPHLLLILVILLVFFGPSRLPGLGKSLGEAIKGFKDGLNGDSIDVTNSTRKTEQLANPQQPPPAVGHQPYNQYQQQQPPTSQNVSNDPNDPNKRNS